MSRIVKQDGPYLLDYQTPRQRSIKDLPSFHTYIYMYNDILVTSHRWTNSGSSPVLTLLVVLPFQFFLRLSLFGFDNFNIQWKCQNSCYASQLVELCSAKLINTLSQRKRVAYAGQIRAYSKI